MIEKSELTDALVEARSSVCALYMLITDEEMTSEQGRDFAAVIEHEILPNLNGICKKIKGEK